MEALIVLALTFGLLWVLFLLPQQRRVRAHQRLVASLEEGDEVILSAGIFGRITTLGPEELHLEVAPGVELRVARQAVLRRVEHAVAGDPTGTGGGDIDDGGTGGTGAGGGDTTGAGGSTGTADPTGGG
jgi:preprotein translocase subunit YajC